MLKRGRNRRAARLRRRAPRASTKARTTGGRLRRMGPRGPLRGRSPLRGLRPPQAARPRPADPPASGARTPLRGSRKNTNLIPRAENNVSSSVHAQQSGFCGPRKRGPCGAVAFVFFRVGPKARFVSRRRARSEGSPGMADGRRRALALGEVRRTSRAMRLGRSPGTGFS